MINKHDDKRASFEKVLGTENKFFGLDASYWHRSIKRKANTEENSRPRGKKKTISAR